MRRALAALLMLAGCSDMPQARSRAEIREIAEDVADDVATRQASDLGGQIDTLKQKVAELEAENATLKAEVSALKSKDDWQDKSVDSLFKNDKTFADRLGMPVGKP